MKVSSTSITPGQPISTKYAFGKYNPTTHVELSENVSPHIAWSDLPPGTTSLALICDDESVPTVGDDVNQEGRTVPKDLPRAQFVHWVLINIDPAMNEIAEGAHSQGVTARGKSGPEAANGCLSGLNDYVGWFAGDDDMAGKYFNYDGPCPPWNDEIIHWYTFTLYALKEKLPLGGEFTAEDVRKAIEPLELGQASFRASYTINPDAIDIKDA